MGNCEQQQISEAGSSKVLPGPHTRNTYLQVAANEVLIETR